MCVCMLYVHVVCLWSLELDFCVHEYIYMKYYICTVNYMSRLVYKKLISDSSNKKRTLCEGGLINCTEMPLIFPSKQSETTRSIIYLTRQYCPCLNRYDRSMLHVCSQFGVIEFEPIYRLVRLIECRRQLHSYISLY